MTALELFPTSEIAQDSPRIRWLKKHRLRTHRDFLPRTYLGPATTQPWVCSNLAMTRCCFGDDEHEAVLEYCSRYKIRHWSCEPQIIDFE